MSKADNWYQALRDNPEEIIEWARAEIREYKKLIKIIKTQLKNEK